MPRDTASPRVRSHTAAHVWSEHRMRREDLGPVVAATESVMRALGNIRKPLYVDEHDAHVNAIGACAETVTGAVRDLIDDLLGPLARRADDAGIDPDRIAIDVTELQALADALDRRA